MDTTDFGRQALETLAGVSTPAMKTRFQAVLAARDGANPLDVAARFKVEPAQVNRWLKAYGEGGVDALLAYRPGSVVAMRSDFDAERIRKLAVETDIPVIRARLFAIVSLYEGDTPKEVARAFGVSSSTVDRWRSEFNDRGPNVWTPVEFEARREADLAVVPGPNVEAMRNLMEMLEGEAKERGKAVLLSANNMSVERIAQETGRTRAWVVTTLKSFNAVGTESIVEASAGNAVTRLAKGNKAILPEGYSAASLREAAAKETDTVAKRALEVLSALYLYGSRKEASQVTGMSAGRIETLIRKLETGGIAAVTGKPSWTTIDPDKVDKIAEGYSDRRAAAKLHALARVIRGESFPAVAADTGSTAAGLRELMTKLDRFGADGIPDMVARTSTKATAKIARPVSRKAKAPEAKTVKTSETVKETMKQSFAQRIAAAVKEMKEVPAVAASKEAVKTPPKTNVPFVAPQASAILAVMATDEDYAGKQMAAAVVDFLSHGNKARTARKFEVKAEDILTVVENIGPTTAHYANTRTKDAIESADLTIGKIRKIAANPPHGWRSKLRSIALLVEGRSVTEVCAISSVNPATLIGWTEQFSAAFKDANKRKSADTTLKAAGMGR